MAVSNEAAALPLIPLRAFHGDVASLPIATCCGGFASCRYLECAGDINVFLANVPACVIGGHSWRRRRYREYLFVMLLNDLEPHGADHQTMVPARFFWMDRHGNFRLAPLFHDTDSMVSLALTAYNARRDMKLAVHRLLGWTFRCPQAFSECRWDGGIDVHHVNGVHGDNRLANLFCWTAAGVEGHRAYSGWFGAQRRWQLDRPQVEDVEQEEVSSVAVVEHPVGEPFLPRGYRLR